MPKPNGATQQGVSEVSDEQKQAVSEARNKTQQARADSIGELARNQREARDAALAAEGMEVVDTSGEEEKKSENKEKEKPDTKVDVSADKVDATQSKKEEEEKIEDLVELKIDGKIQKVPRDKVLDMGVRAMQKELTADQRLEEATALRNEVRELKESLKKQPSSDAVDTPLPDQPDAEQLAKVLIEGDLKDVTTVVKDLLNNGRQSNEVATQVQSMTPDQVYGFVNDALANQAAMAKFQDTPENGGFSDLYKNPTLQQMVFDEEKKLVEAGDKRPPTERLIDAAGTVRAFRDSLLEESGVDVSSFEERKRKKADADQTVEGTNTRSAPKGDPKPLTREQKHKQTLAKMAEGRGQTID